MWKSLLAHFYSPYSIQWQILIRRLGLAGRYSSAVPGLRIRIRHLFHFIPIFARWFAENRPTQGSAVFVHCCISLRIHHSRRAYIYLHRQTARVIAAVILCAYVKCPWQQRPPFLLGLLAVWEMCAVVTCSWICNRLKKSQWLLRVSSLLTLENSRLRTQIMYFFYPSLRTNSYYFRIQRYRIGCCSRDGVCLLRGTNGDVKCNLGYC
jgi:hypothetical protein